MSKSAAELFATSSSASEDRIDGVTIMLIDWWLENSEVPARFESVADVCSFESLPIKKDDAIGRIVLQERDFRKEFEREIAKDPGLFHIFKIVSTADRAKFDEIFGWRFASAVGQKLLDSGWWDKNEKRIQKERKSFKTSASLPTKEEPQEESVTTP